MVYVLKDWNNCGCFPAVREAALTDGNVEKLGERWSNAIWYEIKDFVSCTKKLIWARIKLHSMLSNVSRSIETS